MSQFELLEKDFGNPLKVAEYELQFQNELVDRGSFNLIAEAYLKVRTALSYAYERQIDDGDVGLDMGQELEEKFPGIGELL